MPNMRHEGADLAEYEFLAQAVEAKFLAVTADMPPEVTAGPDGKDIYLLAGHVALFSVVGREDKGRMLFPIALHHEPDNVDGAYALRYSSLPGDQFSEDNPGILFRITPETPAILPNINVLKTLQRSVQLATYKPDDTATYKSFLHTLQRQPTKTCNPQGDHHD